MGLRSGWQVLREHRGTYVKVNLAYYGLVIGGMAWTVANRETQRRLLEAVQEGLSQGGLAPLASVYDGGELLAAVALTFVVNLVVGSLLGITLPSLLIPFGGLAVGAVRAVLWGVIFSPATLAVPAGQLVYGALGAVVLVLEGQGYVLAMLAAAVHGWGFLHPQSVGVEGRWRGYWLGLKRSLRLYPLVAAALAVAAVWEAVVVIVFGPRLVG